MHEKTHFESSLPYQAVRIHAAAVYCSDGRVGEHFDDFLHDGLMLPRYDRVALPGGPASLAGYVAARPEEESVVDELKFLVEAHDLKRVVLIQHQDCAFYTTRLQVPKRFLESLQRADLVRAAFMIQRTTAIEKIDAFFARRTRTGLQFEPVAIS
jgi:hypothetical protein